MPLDAKLARLREHERAIAALRFFFTVTLERPDLVRHLTTVNKPRKGPSFRSVRRPGSGGALP